MSIPRAMRGHGFGGVVWVSLVVVSSLFRIELDCLAPTTEDDEEDEDGRLVLPSVGIGDLNGTVVVVVMVVVVRWTKKARVV